MQQGNPVKTLAVRKAHGETAGCWEFPGGKRESGESLRDCLHRELLEELGISASVGEYIGSSEVRVSVGDINLHAYFVLEWSGELSLTDHDAAVWLPHTQLLSLNWSPADVPLVKKVIQLRLGDS